MAVVVRASVHGLMTHGQHINRRNRVLTESESEYESEYEEPNRRSIHRFQIRNGGGATTTLV